MKDIEICKKIAEINGALLVNVFETHIDAMFEYVLCNNKFKQKRVNYNPLVDDALCLALILKFKIDINHRDKILTITTSQGKTREKFNNIDDFKKTVCLLIIKVNKTIN